MPRRHLIISGTGRAGTTFLMQLLTELGCDTGFSNSWSDINANCHAGMERDLRDPQAPYIVKSPWICDYLGEILDAGDVVIDRAIIPVRDLYAAAESRRRVTETSDASRFAGIVPGGIWHTDEPEAQEAVLVNQFYKLLHTLARHDVPTTLLYFPRFIHEPKYLYKTIRAALPWTRYGRFLKAFRKTCRPELVHDFNTMEVRRDAETGRGML